MANDWPLYEGTKRLKATPMTRGEYNQFRGWQNPADEDPNDAGYVVEYQDGGKPNVEGFDGYVSWSPADVFERAYQLIDPENPPGRQTSHEIASIAARILTPHRVFPSAELCDRLIEAIAAANGRDQAHAAIRNEFTELDEGLRQLAGSALSQVA